MPKAAPKGKAKRKPVSRGWVLKDDRLFTLKVYIVGGPVTKRFSKQNPVLLRTIQIRGDQTLEDLHYTIFDAFGRSDNHMYEFQVGGKGPMDRKARRYGLPGFEESVRGAKSAGVVTITTIGSLGLKVDDAFGYWFDFGDDWWHQINVAAIAQTNPRSKYPKVIERVGKNPPQYVDWDQEEDDE